MIRPKPKRPRDYKAEYQRRLERGRGKGLSRSQSRGHPKAKEKNIRKPRPINDAAFQISLKALRSGKTLAEAAREIRVSPDRLRNQAQARGAIKQRGRKWIVRNELPRRMLIYSHGEAFSVTLDKFSHASKTGRYMSAVNKFLRTNDAAHLNQFLKKSVTDSSGKKYVFETDPNALYRLSASGGESFQDVYRIVAYALQDTQVTWECFRKLKSLYALHELDHTGAHKIHSEASLGKAYLREMGIKPWKILQPDFPPEMIGNIISTYYGGRSEVHIRREAVQVLYCDFLSMYPTVKKQIKLAAAQDKPALENQQLALKILANAASYGIFVELNVEGEKLLQPMLCYGASGNAIPIRQKKFEKAGAFFHPLLATFITGAARLMLAITERQATDAGLDWAFCDTDSMAMAKPELMPEAEFIQKAQQVREWFTPLNPYTEKAPLLKIEDDNYSLSDKTLLQPLYCYAISSKRYALYNIGADGKTVLQKVSAHGLGHLIAPYHKDNESKLGEAQPWQQDVWLEMINAARNNTQPDFSRLQNFNMPAVSRYGATTPALEKWFDKYNENKPYCDRLRPFNFLSAMQANHEFKSLKPVAPYNKDTAKAVARCFDRVTGEKVSKNKLKTNLDAMAQYHLHPETKFLNGDFLDKGKTQRRHVIVKSIQHIGKEANKWEEQFFTGYDPESQIEYGISPEQNEEILQSVLQAVTIYGAKNVAVASRLSERYILKIHKGNVTPSEKALVKLQRAIKTLESTSASERELLQKIKEMMKEVDISIRSVATKLEIDAANLRKILSGLRSSKEPLIRIHAYLMELIARQN